MEWASLNQALLIGKVSQTRRIQWPDGSCTAWFRLTTKKHIATPDGFRVGYDHHQVEVSPGERFFSTCGDGDLVLVRGTIDTYQVQPKGLTYKIGMNQITATGIQLITRSDKPRGPIPTVIREYRRETRQTVEAHNHERTALDGAPEPPPEG